MVKSPVKFDDLAFILLFFFMIVAVLSFSDTMKVNASSGSESDETQAIQIFLDENGVLSREGNLVNVSDFSASDVIDLSCAESASWEVISSAVSSLSNMGVEVSLVVE